MDTVGKRLAYIRKRLGYTQATLASAIGVSRGVISNIEYDQNEPLPIVANAICAELKIRKDWLLSGIEPIFAPDEKSKLLDELHSLCATLSEPQQRFLLDTVRAMQKHLTTERNEEI